MTTYTAVVRPVRDAVEGNQSDVRVVEKEASDEPGSGAVVMGPRNTDVFTSDVDKLRKAADEMLRGSGWTRTGDWTNADDGMYADVERN